MSEIKTKPATDEYREGWDRIFKKESLDELKTRVLKDWQEGWAEWEKEHVETKERKSNVPHSQNNMG